MTPEQRRQWRAEIFTNDALTAAQKLVLLALETFADYRDGTNARPGEATLAAMCGLSPRAVRSALRQGKQLRLIERTGSANSRRGLADVYRLATTGTTVPVISATTGTTVPVNNSHDRNGSTPRPERIDTTTGTAVPTTFPGPSQDLGKELRKPGTSPDDLPQNDIDTPAPLAQSANSNTHAKGPRCAKHAHIVENADVPFCPGCRDVRLAEEADTRTADEKRAAARAARAAERQRQIKACPDCGADGRVAAVDAAGNEAVRECPHPHLNGTPQWAGTQ